MNRLEAARQKMPNGNVYIALEGGFVKINGSWYVRGWTVVCDQDRHRMASASGASVPVPDALVELLGADERFTESMKATYALTTAEAAKLRDIGSNGAFTNGEYVRSDTFADGVQVCLAYIDNERNWNQEKSRVTEP
jgi:non-canonical (house-cleaning) NTP pyrophosphatase